MVEKAMRTDAQIVTAQMVAAGKCSGTAERNAPAVGQQLQPPEARRRLRCACTHPVGGNGSQVPPACFAVALRVLRS